MQFGPIAWKSLTETLYIVLFGIKRIKTILPSVISAHSALTRWLCLCHLASARLNELCTGPVLLVMAVERFIMVVYPFKAQLILTTKYYTLSLLALIVVTLSVSVVETVLREIMDTTDCSRIGRSFESCLICQILSSSPVFMYLGAVASQLISANSNSKATEKYLKKLSSITK